MRKNDGVEIGSFLTLSTGFYFIAPTTISLVEKILTYNLIPFGIILTHSVVAALMIKTYFKLFPLEEKEVNEEDVIKYLDRHPDILKKLKYTKGKKDGKRTTKK